MTAELATISLHDWLQAICVQYGLTVEGDETDEELSEAIGYLAETYGGK